MAILRITCPECGAGLKSADGFTVGQPVECPKCATEFEVEKPVAAKTTALAPSKTKSLSKKTTKLAADDEDEDEDRPKKKKKKKKKAADDEEDWSYKNSWIRYAVLGVLLVVLSVLGYMLYQKKQKDKENSTKAAPDGGGGAATTFVPAGGVVLQPAGGNVGLKQGGNPGFNPKGGNVFPPIQPQPKGRPPVGGINPPPGGPLAGIPFLDEKAMTPAEQEQKKTSLRAALLGTWQANLGGATHTLTYTADGRFTHAGATQLAGTWQVTELIGTRGLLLARTGGGPREVSAVFEGAELIHDTDEKGVSAVFRKKS